MKEWWLSVATSGPGPEEEDPSYGATVAKRRLSRSLNAMRIRAGFSANEVADKLNWNRGRLQRMEANQWRQPEPSFIRDLARIYGADEDTKAELQDLTLHSRARQWWRSYEDVFGPGDEFPGFEHDAARIGVYMPLVLPGLLQTPPYIDALMQNGSQPPAWRARAREARLRRQQILDRPRAAPFLTAVITEASLAYVWGTRAERRDQLDHLIAMSRRPNVELRLLRFEDGPHPGMSSLINIFDFPDDRDESIVYLEIDNALQEVTGADEVSTYKQVFLRICDAALGSAATRSHLERLADAIG
jgi:transcriptional regulator with XRE-family HTH domain